MNFLEDLDTQEGLLEKPSKSIYKPVELDRQTLLGTEAQQRIQQANWMQCSEANLTSFKGTQEGLRKLAGELPTHLYHSYNWKSF
jgi:hypothetical protein